MKNQGNGLSTKAKVIVAVASGVVLVGAIAGILIATAHKHEYSPTVADATCLEQGYTTYACECGEKYVDNYTPAKGHINGKWIVDKEASCTESGSKHQICSVCDSTIKSETIAKLAHTNGEWITDKEATCTEDGSKHQVCSVCETTIKTEKITKLGHTNGAWITDKVANCTEDGSKHQICLVCDATIKTETIAKLGHIDGEWITDKKATCTEDGSQHQVCAVCHATLQTKKISKSGHSWGNWIIDNDATCTTDGAQHRKCTTCQEITTETILMLGHTKSSFLSAKEVNDSCYGTWNCDRCNLIFTEEYIPLSATFSNKQVNYNYGIPYYSWNVTPSNGVGDYTMSYFVYEVWTGKVVLASGNIMSPTDTCVHLDTKDYSTYSMTLAVRVFVYDAVGTVTYDFILNNGHFGNSFSEWISTSYTIGEFIKNDANYV